LRRFKMKATRKLAVAVFVLRVIHPPAALAQRVSAPPPARTPEGIRYVSGGIGSDEARAMKAAARNYDVMLVFAERGRHNYVADVNVDVQDDKGHVIVDVASEGPILLTNLPTGMYTIRAETNGRTLRKHLRVSAKGHVEEVFLWPREAVG
jgi:hypothetical protein